MKSESIEKTAETYDLAHANIKRLLGDVYNQDKVDAIASLVGFEKVQEEIEAMPMLVKPEVWRNSVNEWYKKYDQEPELVG